MLSPSQVQLNGVSCSNCPMHGLSLFGSVSPDRSNDLVVRRSDRFKVPARRHIYERGAAASMTFSVCEGWLLMYRSHSDGGRQGLRILLPGDFVGYMPSGEQHLHHSVVAVTDSVVCAFPQAELHAMMEIHADLAAQITRIQARFMASCQSAMLGLGRKTAEQRIAYLVGELYHRLKNRGLLGADTSRMPFPITQEMLGDLTGLTPVHTNRVLRKLHAEGVLTANRQDLVIHDMSRLMEIGEFNNPAVI